MFVPQVADEVFSPAAPITTSHGDIISGDVMVAPHPGLPLGGDVDIWDRLTQSACAVQGVPPNTAVDPSRDVSGLHQSEEMGTTDAQEKSNDQGDDRSLPGDSMLACLRPARSGDTLSDDASLPGDSMLSCLQPAHSGDTLTDVRSLVGSEAMTDEESKEDVMSGEVRAREREDSFLSLCEASVRDVPVDGTGNDGDGEVLDEEGEKRREKQGREEEQKVSAARSAEEKEESDAEGTKSEGVLAVFTQEKDAGSNGAFEEQVAADDNVESGATNRVSCSESATSMSRNASDDVTADTDAPSNGFIDATRFTGVADLDNDDTNVVSAVTSDDGATNELGSVKNNTENTKGVYQVDLLLPVVSKPEDDFSSLRDDDSMLDDTPPTKYSSVVASATELSLGDDDSTDSFNTPSTDSQTCVVMTAESDDVLCIDDIALDEFVTIGDGPSRAGVATATDSLDELVQEERSAGEEECRAVTRATSSDGAPHQVTFSVNLSDTADPTDDTTEEILTKLIGNTAQQKEVSMKP